MTGQPIPMPFNLRVRITGLCVFYPRRPQSQMSVLMVGPVKEAPHYPRAFYDKAYATPDPSVQPRGRPADYERVDLGGILDLSALRGSDGGVEPPACIVDPFCRDLPANPPSVAATLVLPPGVGEPSRVQHPWKLLTPCHPEPKPMRLAWYVDWIVKDIPGGSFLAPPLPRLFPKSGAIELIVSNVIASESTAPLPEDGQPPLKHGSPMPHFGCYYDLYGDGGARPELDFDGEEGTRGTPYTCLPSGGH